MGLEAECTVRVGRKASDGTALLEGDRLTFRGEFGLGIPFEEMKDVGVDGDALVIRTAEQEARFEIGAAVAEIWLRLIKEPKSLFEKLEVSASSRVAVVDIGDSLFLTALRERTASVAEGRVPEGATAIFLGAETREALRKVPLVRTRMGDATVLWIVRPKGSPAVAEADVLEAVRAFGLVDTKVVAFSRTHTAHRCVIPVELRGRPLRVRPPIVSIPPSSPGVSPRKPGRAAPGPSPRAAPKPARKAAAKTKPKAAPATKAPEKAPPAKTKAKGRR